MVPINHKHRLSQTSSIHGSVFTIVYEAVRVAGTVWWFCKGWMVHCSNPGGEEILTSVQTSPETHPTSCTMRTVSVLGVNKLGCDDYHPPPSSRACEYKAIRLLPTMFSWNILWQTLHLSSIILEILCVVTTDMHHLMTGIRSEKCVRRFCHRANVYLHKFKYCSIAYYTPRLLV